MLENEKLSSNNLSAQLELYSDICQNYSSILHHISEKGTLIHEIIRKSKKSDSGEVTLSKEDYEKLFDISYILSDRNRYENLGILAKTAVPDNFVKLKILSTLKR